MFQTINGIRIGLTPGGLYRMFPKPEPGSAYRIQQEISREAKAAEKYAAQALGKDGTPDLIGEFTQECINQGLLNDQQAKNVKQGATDRVKSSGTTLSKENIKEIVLNEVKQQGGHKNSQAIQK